MPRESASMGSPNFFDGLIGIEAIRFTGQASQAISAQFFAFGHSSLVLAFDPPVMAFELPSRTRGSPGVARKSCTWRAEIRTVVPWPGALV